MNRDRLEQLLGAFRTCRILVVGDFFLDKYLDVDPRLAEPSVETGKTAHQVVAVRTSPGAAGTVVNNLVALETGTIHTVGVIGDDGEGYTLLKELDARGCLTGGLIRCSERMTPTYLKPRDANNPSLAGEHERYDTKNRLPLPAQLAAGVLAAVDARLGDVDAVIIADQVEEDDCGVVTAGFRDSIAERAAAAPHTVFWADSRKHIHRFRHVIVKPNQFEAVGREKPLPDEKTVDPAMLCQAARDLRERNHAPVFVTRGEEGMLVTDPQPVVVPGVHLDGPIDSTGAGDSATAGAVLALACGASLREAALIGILVSSITVQQLATTGTATPAQVLERLQLWRAQHPEGLDL